MLVDVVRNGDWPETKNELFELSTKLLLTEHNPNNARHYLGKYDSASLVEAAGATCASLLISDTPGISLLENQSDEAFPSYTQAPFDDQSVLSALTRRAFTTVGEERVNYQHRTIAEFLAAVWLAGKIKEGFPFGRLLSLISVNGQPAPELRGLHAWLPAKLPQYAMTFIDSDPYGVLVYGDSSTLSATHRKALLKSLEKLSEKDPWFRSEGWASEPLGGLSSLEMVEEFRKILSSSDQFHLRSLVLDSIKHGPKLPEMAEDLLKIFCNENTPYVEREKAFEALISAVPEGVSLTVTAFKDRIIRCGSSARIRASVISQLCEGNFSPVDVLHIFEDVLGDDHECAIGEFWPLCEKLPIDILPEVLDLLSPLFSENEQLETPERRNEREVEFNFSQMLTRLLYGKHIVDNGRIWNWLIVLYRQNRYRGESVAKEKIISWLARNEGLVCDWFKEEVGKLDIENCNWSFWHAFKGTILWQIDQAKAVEIIFEVLPKKAPFAPKDKFLYEMALILCFGTSPPARKLFETLYQFGNDHLELAQTRKTACRCEVEDWQLRDRARNLEVNEKSLEANEKNRIDFEKNLEAIRAGCQEDWLHYVAKIYLATLPDVDKRVSPETRLKTKLGDEYSTIALEGLRASVSRTDLPSMDDIVDNYMRDRFYVRWLWFVAGMDEGWKQKPSLQGYSDSQLEVALAINLFFRTYTLTGNVQREIVRGWKEALFEYRKDIVIKVFSFVARRGLESDRSSVTGLYEFCKEDRLIDERGGVALALLRDFPSTNPQHLGTLLKTVVGEPEERENLVRLAHSVLNQNSKVRKEQRVMWLAVVFLLSFDRFKNLWKKYLSKNESAIWTLRDFVGDAINHRQNPLKLSVSQIEFLIKWIGGHFENVGHPMSSTGNQSPWDASHFVRRLVEILSVNISSDATSLLHSFSNDDSLISYRDHFKHAASNQLRLKVQKEFMRPDWASTVNALAKGEPAHTADLHALAVDHLRDAQRIIKNSNTDIYKSFWNVDAHNKISTPRVEDSCRDKLIDILRPILENLNVRSEPEGRMVADKRTDIVLFHAADKKLPLELKRDTHADLWTACENQLDRLYTRDPEASGYGIYVVFWFGEKRKSRLTGPPRHLKHLSGSDSPEKLEEALRSLIKPVDRQRLEVVVIDVSPPKG